MLCDFDVICFKNLLILHQRCYNILFTRSNLGRVSHPWVSHRRNRSRAHSDQIWGRGNSMNKKLHLLGFSVFVRHGEYWVLNLNWLRYGLLIRSVFCQLFVVICKLPFESRVWVDEPTFRTDVRQGLLKGLAKLLHKVTDYDCCRPAHSCVAMHENLASTLDRLLDKGLACLEVLS